MDGRRGRADLPSDLSHDWLAGQLHQQAERYSESNRPRMGDDGGGLLRPIGGSVASFDGADLADCGIDVADRDFDVHRFASGSVGVETGWRITSWLHDSACPG